MDKDTSQLQLYQHFLSFFLPDGILDFFEPVWMETQSPDFPVRDRKAVLHVRHR